MNTNRKNILVGVLLITFFLELWAPATSGSTLSGANFKLVIRIAYFAMSLVILLAMLIGRKTEIKAYNVFLAITPLVYFFIQKIWVFDSSSASTSTLLLCVLFALQTDEIKAESYRWIKCLIVIMSLTGIVCYLSFIFDLGLPYKQMPYYSLIKSGVWYLNYHVSYFYMNAVQVRLCGLFNEPGWFGTFLAFCLCVEDLNMRKLSNIIILIAGILTFSLAFILLIVLYFVLKNITDWRKWVWLVLLVSLYLFVLPNVHTGNEIIDSFIGRIVLTAESTQNSRTTNAFDTMFEAFLRSPDMIWGRGAGYSRSLGGGNLSIKTDIVDFGILGVLAFYAPILISLIYRVRKNKKAVCFLLCIGVSLYQRPWLFEASNFFLTLSAVSYLSITDRDSASAGIIVRRWDSKKITMNRLRKYEYVYKDMEAPVWGESTH